MTEKQIYIATAQTPPSIAKEGEEVDVSSWPEARVRLYVRLGRLAVKED